MMGGIRVARISVRFGKKRERERERYLLDHLMTEDVMAVDDLDGEGVAGVEVLGELDLGKAAFPDRLAKLVPPHAGPRRRYLHAHFSPPRL